NLVCEYAWLSATADSMFMVGVLLGSIIFGDLSHRFGRKPIFFLSLVLQIIGGIGAAVLPNYSSYVAARMLIGATTSGMFLVAYVIAMEMIGPFKRMVAGLLCQVFGTTGYLWTGFFAYFIKEWRILQTTFSVPEVLFLSCWWCVDMTWLIITFAMIGKLGITAAYGTLYIFSTEQFPTVIRNVALGASSTCARVGGILAPFVNILAEYWRPLPLVIFGALSLATQATALLLPETMNQNLPDTVAEGENFGKLTSDKQDINVDVLLETKETEK
ncbi:organic cation transporter protein-like, partial [Schistocerca serialis cubense]|uniref:organic cation transporter protein-like n=1 Tax=Schistocerca serialis cubense TaxID=2023355 RepID=UPI00214E61FB